MSTIPVPFADLALLHGRVAREVEAGIARVLDTTAFIGGPQVQAFEAAYADYCETAHCVGVGNGTDAVELALRATGIAPGDEVLIPANTFVATAEAVVRAGAVPVPVDVDQHYLIDPRAAADHVTPRTRAAIGVHLYGQMAPMEQLAAAVGDDVVLIEDAAQSQGARRHGRRSGSLGLAAATSFYPGKNLGAYGDAGAVTTGSAEVAHHLRQLRNHGGIAKYEHVVIGTNSRLDTIQAAVLEVKLAHLDAWNDQRREAAGLYEELLRDCDRVGLPGVAEGNEHVWHLYVVQVPDRDAVVEAMSAAGIGVGVHYPTPVHRLPAFAPMASACDHPVAEHQAAHILSLPMFPGITVAQQERVAETLRAAL